jgi:hypothetical protein
VFFTLLLLFYGESFAARNAALMTVFLAWRHQRNFRNLWAADAQRRRL